MTEELEWYRLGPEEALNKLGSGGRGLEDREAAERLTQYGPNELKKKKPVSPWVIFLSQFKNFLVIILIVAVVLSLLLGEVADSIVIAVILIFASVLGFVQEYRAERALEALKKLAAPTASVLRDGQEREIDAIELVPGDVIILRTGDRIPADARLIEVASLIADESPLTGESVNVGKIIGAIDKQVEAADRQNMVFMGTAAVYGRGRAVVTHTGMQTQFGRIAGLLQEVKPGRTRFQASLSRIGGWLGIIALSLSFMLAAVGVLRGHELLEMLIWGISLAVAAVPEALPAVVVISLALGVRRMVKRNALIRKLPAVETLGSTTYICSDKTGTLTQDEMTVRRIYLGDKVTEVGGSGYAPEGGFTVENRPLDEWQNKNLELLLRIGLLCNDTSLVSTDGDWEIKGDSTEGALVVAAAKAGLWQQELRRDYPRYDEIPFTSEAKRMTTLHRTPEGGMAYAKGALEIILESSTNIIDDGKERKLTEGDKKRILEAAHAMAGDALRVLAIAYRPIKEKDKAEDAEEGLTFVGFVGIIDPPRPEAKEAIHLAGRAGIKSVMITGDFKETAIAVAIELGLFNHEIALSGSELDKLGDEELDELVEKIAVYARVSPAHKIRVVEALNRKGHVVAMTGDGVNDAPALKRADIGISMGITGTDVTKEVADMVLTDDNYASIVSAIEEGRGIFENIKKFLMYLLSSNIGEVLLLSAAIILGPVIGLPAGAIPLVAIQILWVNLVTDGLPAIGLSMDPPDPDIMRHGPRPSGQGVFTRPVLFLMAVAGVWIGIVTLGVFKWALGGGKSIAEAQTLSFLTLVIIQFFNAYNFRAEEHSIFKTGFLANRWLNYSILAGVALMLIIVYTPALQEPFNTYALDGGEWLRSILLAATVFPVLELAKLALRRRSSSPKEEP